MASLLHRFGRGRVVATTVVIVTAGLLLAVTRMVFSHPAESAKEPGIVLTATPRVTSSQSSTTARPSRSASSTQHEPGSAEAGAADSSDSSTQGHAPQAVEPDPPVAVDEAMTLGRMLSTDDSPRFLNGLLGRIGDLADTLR